jgi:tRNA A37 N6-isopentenylltransferase MiaA
MQGILEFERQQLGYIDDHFDRLIHILNKKREALQEEFRERVNQMKATQESMVEMARQNELQLYNQELEVVSRLGI